MASDKKNSKRTCRLCSGAPSEILTGGHAGPQCPSCPRSLPEPHKTNSPSPDQAFSLDLPIVPLPPFPNFAILPSAALNRRPHDTCNTPGITQIVGWENKLISDSEHQELFLGRRCRRPHCSKRAGAPPKQRHNSSRQSLGGGGESHAQERIG